MSESLQHKLDRVPPAPRADHLRRRDRRRHGKRSSCRSWSACWPTCRASPRKPLKPLKDRKFVQIDRDNFNDVLAKAAPRRGHEGRRTS